MERNFDPDAFVQRIGRRLVEQFDEARAASSPSTVGAAMEQPVRDQLEQILPRGLGVGSGFVIDSYGGTGRQTDIVLYEKDICPVFSINNTPETTYYPCECVVAVGEVKSELNRNSLQDAFSKIASVKQLQRHMIRHFVPDERTGVQPPVYRSYGSLHTGDIVDVSENPGACGQIYGFVLAGNTRLATDTLATSFLELSHNVGDVLSPNLAVVLNGALLNWGRMTTEQPGEVREINGKYVFSVPKEGPERYVRVLDAESAEFLDVDNEAEPFRVLVRSIRDIYYRGRTSDLRSLDRYFEKRQGTGGHRVRTFPKAASPRTSTPG